MYYWQFAAWSFHPFGLLQVERNNRRIDYKWTTEQHSEDVFNVVFLLSECQDWALSRRFSARWMINESECFHNWPHKQISTQLHQHMSVFGRGEGNAGTHIGILLELCFLVSCRILFFFIILAFVDWEWNVWYNVMCHTEAWQMCDITTILSFMWAGWITCPLHWFMQWSHS